jgi:hypothetical protein
MLSHEPHDMGTHAAVISIKPSRPSLKSYKLLAMVVQMQAMTILDLGINGANMFQGAWINGIPRKFLFLLAPVSEIRLSMMHWRVRPWSCFLTAADKIA